MPAILLLAPPIFLDNAASLRNILLFASGTELCKFCTWQEGPKAFLCKKLDDSKYLEIEKNIMHIGLIFFESSIHVSYIFL